MLSQVLASACASYLILLLKITHVRHWAVVSPFCFSHNGAWFTENSQSFLLGLKTSWATGSLVMESRAMQRVYPKNGQQRASPWRLTMLPVRGWGLVTELCQRATSSPSAQEGRHFAERWVIEGSLPIDKLFSFRVYGFVINSDKGVGPKHRPSFLFCGVCHQLDIIANEGLHNEYFV